MLRFPALALLIAALLLAACGDAPADDASAAARADTAYADRMAEEHAGDSTNATGTAREPATPVESEMVNYGPEAPGYMAYPAQPDSVLEARGGGNQLPGLIVVHEWWGLNDNIRAAARRLAGEGYRVLAVDLYGGQVAETPDEARSIMQAAMGDEDALVSNMQSAHQYLSGEQQAPRVGVMGWCFGGGMALQAGLAMPSDLDALVIYYGRIQGTSRAQLQPLEMPILGVFGEEDGGIPADSVRAFEQTLADLGKDARVEIYPDAGHAFANPTGQNYVPGAAADAWDQTTAFLEENLYAQGGAAR